MQFSKLRLNGFKSFVDPTDLIISDGLTGVVGPNGCGKSNLLEALRWVMGENRPTVMRGGGMEDVIFNGASARGARNFAEVSLVLDNGDRLVPAAFNDSDSLEIVRRITRDVGSAFKVNSKDARARDVQMLFADASTGSHSPSLVRQGQITELVNAKPKSRRRILEEAAGISGLYQRRHEAELKLNGAEINLKRVEDVLEQLDSQLGSLARQARQAARYREIGESLRHSEGLLLYRRWREAEMARQAAADQLLAATKASSAAQGEASEAAKIRAQAEGLLPPLRDEEAIASSVLQRLQVERDGLEADENRARHAIDTLQNRIAQLGQDIDRETELNRDAMETIEKLDWEKEALQKAADGHEGRVEAANTVARDAAGAMQNQEATLDALSEDVARQSARHQSAHRMLDEAETVVKGRERQLVDATEGVQTAMTGLVEADTRLQGASTNYAVAQETVVRAEAVLLDTEKQRSAAQEDETGARGILSESEGEANALAAEVAALERVIARDQASGDQLIDHVQADRGYEAALGAALADDLKAPVAGPTDSSGWVELAGYSDTAVLPAGASRLSEYVKAPAVLDRRLGQIGLVDRASGAALQSQLKPGQRLVSVEGDLWRWDGYRVGAEDAPSAAALRLQQVNRLNELRDANDVAQRNLSEAQENFQLIHNALQAAIGADQGARVERKAADAAATEATRRMSRAEADSDMLSGKLETLKLAQSRLDEEANIAKATLAEAEAGIRDLGDLDAERAKVEQIRQEVEEARTTMLAKRGAFDELRREGDTRLRRSQEITKEVSGWRHRLETADKRISELQMRKGENEEALKQAVAAPEEIAAKRQEIGNAITEAGNRQAKAADNLSKAEGEMRRIEQGERDAERAASEAREARGRADAVADAAGIQVATATDRIREDLDTDPEELLEQLATNPDDIPVADKIEQDVMRLRRQRDSLGAVNLRAEEDAKEVTEERDNLANEKADLDEAIAKLRIGIASLNKEGRLRLLDAFEEVNKNFSMLFKHLFGGGEANLVLVESDDPLEAGLELMCQPPGKKLATLSLLSGGEQTLTAMALIFAVFLANPSPICVLDEVDAPLDDANVTRFCDLLDEMKERTDTRFMLITHHAVTMSRMDRLYGVTMAEQGVSQLVSVDLQQAENMIDA